MMEEITRNRAFSGDLRMLQPTRGSVLRIPWQVVPGAFAIRSGGRVWNGYLWVLFASTPGTQKAQLGFPATRSILRSLDHIGPLSPNGAEVQANKDYAARFHRDKNNLGPSWIMAHFVSRGNSRGLFQKNGNPKFNSLSLRFPHQKRVSVYYTVFEDKPILAAGRLALYLGFWGCICFCIVGTGHQMVVTLSCGP